MNPLIVTFLNIYMSCFVGYIPNPHTINGLTPVQQEIIYTYATSECKEANLELIKSTCNKLAKDLGYDFATNPENCLDNVVEDVIKYFRVSHDTDKINQLKRDYKPTTTTEPDPFNSKE